MPIVVRSPISHQKLSRQMDGAMPAVSIFSEVGPKLAVKPIRQYAAGIELIMANGFATLAVASFLVVLSQVRSTTNTYPGLAVLVELLLAVLLRRHVQRNPQPVRLTVWRVCPKTCILRR